MVVAFDDVFVLAWMEVFHSYLDACLTSPVKKDKADSLAKILMIPVFITPE